MILIQTFKWNYILQKQGIKLRFKYLTKLHMIALFYEVITPAKIGYFVKIAYLKDKTKKSVASCSSSVILDRAMDFFVVFLFAAIGTFLIASAFMSLFYTTTIMLICLFIGLILLVNRKTSRFFLLFFYKLLIPKNLKQKVKESFNEFYNSIPAIKHIFILFFLTLIFWFLVYTQAYITSLAFGLKINYAYFMFVFPIAVIFSLIPISISGFGTRETALLVLFSGLEKSKIVSFSVAWASISLIFYSLIALFLLLKKTENHGFSVS